MPDLLTIGVGLVQGGIVLIILEAVRRRNFPGLANALVSLTATLLPMLAESSSHLLFGKAVVIPSEVTLWIAVAGLLHSYGMLGPYDTVWWWDYLTHTISAAFIAAIIYGGLVVVGQRGGLTDPSISIGILTVLSTLLVGLVWELIELVARWIGELFDVEPVLVQYGWRDTAMDFVFDGIGALVVVVLDVRLFVQIADQLPNVSGVLLGGGVIVIAVGVVLLVLSIMLSGYPQRDGT